VRECDLHGMLLIPGPSGLWCPRCEVEEHARRDEAAGRRPEVSAAHSQRGSRSVNADGSYGPWSWERSS